MGLFPVDSDDFRKAVEEGATDDDQDVRDCQYLEQGVKLVGGSVPPPAGQDEQGEAVDEQPHHTHYVRFLVDS